MRGRTASFVAILTVLMLAISPALAGDESDLAGRAQAWKKAFEAKNSAGIAALYTEDAARLPYQEPTIKGRKAIQANIEANYEAGVVKVGLAVLGAESHGDLAWGHGTYDLKDEQGATVQKGKWMNVSKKVGGKWLIHADIWNTDEPEE